MLFTWFMLGGCILLFIPQNLTNKFQFAFAHTFRWPLRVGRNISLSTQINQLPSDFVSRSEYNKLQNHLTNVIEQRDEAYHKIEKLSGLRERSALEGAKIVIAEVISATIDELHCELIIDRGENDGLKAGQFVMGANSIIGSIYDVSPQIAKVLLLTDSKSKMAVKIAGTGRVMQGCGNNSAKIRLIKDSVKIGEAVYVDKKAGFLDAAVVAAKVAQCQRNEENPLLWDITVDLACDVGKLGNVAVIIMNKQ